MPDQTNAPVHPRFAAAMAVLSPNARPRVDYVLKDDGDGPYLAEWNLPAAVPTTDQITAALVQADWNIVRAKRSPLLDATDIIALRCFKAGVPFPSNWRAYTQALRDVTKQADPASVQWPTPPADPAGV